MKEERSQVYGHTLYIPAHVWSRVCQNKLGQHNIPRPFMVRLCGYFSPVRLPCNATRDSRLTAERLRSPKNSCRVVASAVRKDGSEDWGSMKGSGGEEI